MWPHSLTSPQICTKFGANRSSLRTASPNIWICDPLKIPEMPWGIVGRIVFSLYVHSQTNPPTCTKFGANRCSRLTSSPDFWICDPLPPMPPGVLRRDLYLAYVHSQMNPQMWTKVGDNQTASPYFFIVDPLKPPSDPLVSRGAICLAYIHSHMNLHTCAQFGANRSSRFVGFPNFVLRLVPLFAAVRADSRKNTPKNKIYTSKIIIPARTCRHQRH